MRLTSVVTPFNDHNLQLVSQVGVTDVTTRSPRPEPTVLREMCDHVARFGLQIRAVEGNLTIGCIITGTEQRDADVEERKALFRTMVWRTTTSRSVATTSWPAPTGCAPGSMRGLMDALGLGSATAP